jgi:hypothetical protein
MRWRSLQDAGLPSSIQRGFRDEGWCSFRNGLLIDTLTFADATSQVLMEAWSALEDAAQKATTLVELRRCHEEYVAVATRCCFLEESASSTVRSGPFT